MQIDYKDEKLRKLCLVNREAVKKLGVDGAKKLQARLSDIEAAAHVQELIAGRPHPLLGDRNGQFSLTLAKGIRLVFGPNHNPAPEKKYGGIDWAQVTSVTIIFIGDYHD